MKFVIAEKEDEANPVKYFVTNKIDAPTERVVHSYSKHCWIEKFFKDPKQDLGFEDVTTTYSRVRRQTGRYVVQGG